MDIIRQAFARLLRKREAAWWIGFAGPMTYDEALKFASVSYCDKVRPEFFRVPPAPKHDHY